MLYLHKNKIYHLNQIRIEIIEENEITNIKKNIFNNRKKISHILKGDILFEM